jgi:hypothetical protein
VPRRGASLGPPGGGEQWAAGGGEEGSAGEVRRAAGRRARRVADRMCGGGSGLLRLRVWRRCGRERWRGRFSQAQIYCARFCPRWMRPQPMDGDGRLRMVGRFRGTGGPSRRTGRLKFDKVPKFINFICVFKYIIN